MPQDEYRATPLIAACDDKIVPVAQLLIDHGADVHYQDNVCKIIFFHSLKHGSFLQHGDTALHFAAQDGHPEIVKILVQSHAKLNVKNNVSTS